MQWRQFLVDIDNEPNGRVLKLDSIKGGDEWKEIDLLIFDSWHWWFYKPPNQPYDLNNFSISFFIPLNHLPYFFQIKVMNSIANARWDYIQMGNTTFQNMDRVQAFTMALETWAKWVDSYVNPLKTRVFFQGISPSHYRAKDWGRRNHSRDCIEETEPLQGSVSPMPRNQGVDVVKRVLSTMKKPAYFLDISTLSELRPDAHPAAYNNPHKDGRDCTHWCVAGVPDTWNQLLYVAVASDYHPNFL
ncbi:hypothetical protein Ancab_025611 [Ancistrocladus abbreviatus]